MSSIDFSFQAQQRRHDNKGVRFAHRLLQYIHDHNHECIVTAANEWFVPVGYAYHDLTSDAFYKELAKYNWSVKLMLGGTLVLVELK